MPPISRIKRLRHPGVLRDFTWPSTLPDFAQYNLIYGWNGSGKTTISRLFRALELRQAPTGEAELTVNDNPVSGSSFSNSTLPVRVFNRDFVSESVFPVGGGDVAPIFVLGKESAERQSEVEKLKDQKAKREEKAESARKDKGQASKILDKHCIDQASAIRETLRSSGENSYNNYDKRRYKQDADGMILAGDKETHLLSGDDRERLLAQSRASQKNKVQEVQYRFPDLEQCREKATQLLQSTVVSSAISTLKDDTELASWTRQGLGLHQKRSSEHCLFCEQGLPDGRIKDLEAHFSTEYENFVRRLDSEVNHLEELLQEASKVQPPNRAELYEDLSEEYDVQKMVFGKAIENTKTNLRSLIGALNDKKTRLFEPVNNVEISLNINTEATNDLNTIIQKHNRACDEFDSRIAESRDKLALDSVARSLDDYIALSKGLKAAENALSSIQSDVKNLGDKALELEREIIEHRDPAEELNEDLKQYLGHNEIRLHVKDTGYKIVRSGEPARALSEGEMTAIALLYFLKSLRDRSFELERGVVVLDDPVSSLDANALFLAFSFIRQRTNGCAQIFILTHNFSLFRQVRNWFHHIKGQGKSDIKKRPGRFYMLECTLTEEGRRSLIRPLDPLLEKFESEYHYLFSRIYQHSKNEGAVGLERSYIFPNMARRLLETFLAFRQPQHAGELSQKMQRVSFDEGRKTRILRFLHTHSHADEIGEPEHDLSSLGEAQAVLGDLLELMNSEDPRHFSAMVNLVDPPQEQDEE